MALGVRDRFRGEFWRFMNRVLVEHRGKIEDGLTHAALGYHLRTLAEQMTEGPRLDTPDM